MIDPSSQGALRQTADIRKNILIQLSLLPYLILALLLFTVSLLFGLSTSPELNSGTLEELVQTLKPIVDSLGSLGPLALILFIFLNNAIKALISMVLGIVVGLPTLFFVGTNGFIIGVTIAALHSHVGYGIIAASLVPHGIIEIPILLLTSALGLKIGAESVRFLTGQVSSVKTHLVRSLKIYVKWVLACLFFAAIIEVLITPQIISLVGGK
jgi:stage II sporulation protein M